MFRKISILAVLALYGVVVTKAQVCTPDPIGGIQVIDDNWLTWDTSDNCENVFYRVEIHSGGSRNYHYMLTVNTLDISFLPYCREYNFSLAAMSNHVVGIETNLHYNFTFPEDIDVQVSNFRGNQIENDLLISWEVGWRFRECITHFDVSVWTNDTEVPETFDLDQPGHLFENVAHCMNYRIEVASNYFGIRGTTGSFNYTMPAKVNNPTLVEVKQTAVSITTIWNLEGYSINRCEVTELFVNGTRFNQTITINDSPTRPDIEVSITDLRANSMYFFNVSTKNSAGISDPFNIAVQTLPLEYTSD